MQKRKRLRFTCMNGEIFSCNLNDRFRLPGSTAQPTDVERITGLITRCGHISSSIDLDSEVLEAQPAEKTKVASE